MIDWLPGFQIIRSNAAGSWAKGTFDPRIVLHTTEGGSVESAVGAYRKNNSWPHMTVDPVERIRVQHTPLTAPARALRNTATAGETNRDPQVWQIEIVATAHRRATAKQGLVSVEALTYAELDWLGTEVLRPLAEATGTPLVAPLTFHGEDAGWTLASPSAKQRMSPAEWQSFRGICGHQHVPENSHWDPGPLNVERIIMAARGATKPPAPKPPTPPSKELTVSEAKEINGRLDILAQWTKDEVRKTNGRLDILVQWSIDKFGATAEDIAELELRLKDLER